MKNEVIALLCMCTGMSEYILHDLNINFEFWIVVIKLKAGG